MNELSAPDGPEDWSLARTLVCEYRDALGLDLSFQDFDAELDALESVYAPPGGAFLIARTLGRPAGCGGLRVLDDGSGELKRLYVRRSARGRGLGRALVSGLVAHARHLRLPRVRLDTLPDMAAAQRLYAGLGFRRIAPYRWNPVRGSAFFELDLREN